MPQKVLVVEDEEDLQRLLFFHLPKEGYAVICAGEPCRGFVPRKPCLLHWL